MGIREWVSFVGCISAACGSTHGATPNAAGHAVATPNAECTSVPVFISEVPSKPQPSPCERTIEAARERPMVSTIACVRASKVDRERARFVGHRVRVLGVLRGNHLDDPEEPSYVIPIAEGFRGECRETMVTVEGDVVENADIPVIEYVNVSDGPGLVGLANAHIVRLVDD